MSEQYKTNYVNYTNTYVLRTVKDLKEFVYANLHLTDEEMYDMVKSLMPITTDVVYIKSSIKSIKRKRKIELLLKSENNESNNTK